jgi:ABC-type polysaccharide/polyol phosphate export permease
MTRGRLGRYSAWQIRDFLIDRGIAVLVIGVLLGYLAIEPMRSVMGPAWRHNGQIPMAMLIANIASPIVSLAVLIGVNGIVSNDRKTGYYRFLFAKPISPPLFYAQLFAVNFAGVLIVMAALGGLFRLWVGPIAIPYLLLYAAIIYIAMGGIGFFISAATRFDWVVLSAVWVGSRIIRAVYHDVPDFRARLIQILPPVHRVDAVANDLLTGRMADVSSIVWLAGYGALFFAIGLLTVHRRSMVD